MFKTMDFGGKKVSFSTSFAWCFIYKAQFRDDPIKTLLPAVKSALGDPAIEQIEDEEAREQAQAFVLLEELGVIGVAQIAWAMAKLADKGIPEPMAWVDSFGDDFPVMDILVEVITDAIESCFATKKSEAPIPAEPTK